MARGLSDEDWAQRVRRLEAEIVGLKRGMRTRGLIEQAKGRLSERLGIEPEAAFDWLNRQSQATNVRVVDVAADVMNAATPAGAPPDRGSVSYGRLLQRVRAAVASAEEPAELLAAVAEEGLRPVGAVTAAIATSTASAGESIVLHQWQAGDAVAAERRTTHELSTEDGVLIVGWPEQAEPDDSTKDYLEQVAVLAAARLATLPHAAPDGRPIAYWLEAIVDGVATPAVVLSPVLDHAALADFRIERLNAAAARAWSGRTVAGRRLLDVEPEFAGDGVFDACRAAFSVPDGADASQPRSAHGWRAVRVADRLLLSWPAEVPFELRQRLDQSSAMEVLGGFGWASWYDSGEPIDWSEGMYRLLGRDRQAGPARLDQLLEAVSAPVRAALAERLYGVLAAVPAGPVEVQLDTGGEHRVVRLLAVAGMERGRPTLNVLLQDLTAARARDAALTDASDNLARQRIESASQRAHTRRLRATLFPRAETRLRHGELTLVARHAAPESIPSFRGDFYEITRVDGDLVVAVGDVFGSGVDAADAMVRLRHFSRALGRAGLGPAEILSRINEDFGVDVEPPLASLVVVRVGPTGGLRWAQAGHFSPILVRGGRGRSLRRPRGDSVGLQPETRYSESAVELRPGDLLALFTDGVLSQPGASRNPTATFAAELASHAAEDASVLAQRFTRPVEDEACIVVLQWPGRLPGSAGAATQLAH